MTRRVAVVGGGPAGLVAAETLAAAGVPVTVHDRMPSVARKFVLAGRSGLNLTNGEPVPTLLDRYGDRRDRLAGPIRGFGPDALRTWSADLGVETFVGSSGRVFPVSMRSTPLLRAWLGRLDGLGVRFETRRRWIGWATSPTGAPDPRRLRFRRHDGAVVDEDVDAAVLALGGASWPRVGSDGGWVEVLVAAGVDVAPLRPSNAGVLVEWSAPFVDRFHGTPLKNVAVSVVVDDGSPTRGDVPTRRGVPVRGDLTVTRRGLEGTPVYTWSSVVRDVVDRTGTCRVLVDLHPDVTLGQLTERLSRRRAKETDTSWLRRAGGLSAVAIGLVRESTGNRIPTDPAAAASAIRAAVLTAHGVAPIDRAISSAGGVRFAELDESLMVRRLPGTFVAGEMLDWDAPTGGYLLQAVFSTGVAAAKGALDWLGDWTG